jgi:poly-D-alanine transfer protein DltD
VLNQELASSNIEWLELHRSGLIPGAKMAEKHIERARLLREIVEKLRRGKLENRQVDEQVQRINLNQHIVNQIKHLELATNQLQYERMIEKIKVPEPQVQSQLQVQFQQHQGGHQEQSREEMELEQKLWVEMALLKKDL